MTIYGLSQTTGAERTLEVERADGGVALHSRDPEGYADLDRVVVPAEALLAALIDRPAERTTIPGVVGDREASRRLEFTVRGNEVQLWVHTGTGRQWDVAVGFDDFQDALEQASDPA
jgi:hypothetical protein